MVTPIVQMGKRRLSGIRILVAWGTLEFALSSASCCSLCAWASFCRLCAGSRCVRQLRAGECWVVGGQGGDEPTSGWTEARLLAG